MWPPLIRRKIRTHERLKSELTGVKKQQQKRWNKYQNRLPKGCTLLCLVWRKTRSSWIYRVFWFWGFRLSLHWFAHYAWTHYHSTEVFFFFFFSLLFSSVVVVARTSLCSVWISLATHEAEPRSLSGCLDLQRLGWRCTARLLRTVEEKVVLNSFVYNSPGISLWVVNSDVLLTCNRQPQHSYSATHGIKPFGDIYVMQKTCTYSMCIYLLIHFSFQTFRMILRLAPLS